PPSWIEPDRFELFEAPPYRFGLSRRRFLEAAGAGVAVLVVHRASAARALEASPGMGAASPAGPLADGVAAADAAGSGLEDTIGAWLHIAEAGQVTVYTGKVEVGQDIRTSLAQ